VERTASPPIFSSLPELNGLTDERQDVSCLANALFVLLRDH
jgi:hypothetical protein